MDSLTDRFQDGDLTICEGSGFAYQTDMKADRVTYGADYMAKVDAYDGTEIALAVNAGRVAMLLRHLPKGARVFDIGAGSGAFVRAAGDAGFVARGYDVMPQAVDRLKAARVYANDPGGFDAVTLWDTIEHMEDAGTTLRQLRLGQLLFASIPVFDDLRKIRESKHFRPGEHLYYFTERGFIDWMASYGFRFVEQSAHETDAGRESIGAFAFKRVMG